MLTDIIIAVSEMGLAPQLYKVFEFTNFVVVFLFAAWYANRIGMGYKKGVLAILIVYPIAFLLMTLQYWIESGFQRTGQCIVDAFIFIPLINYFAAKILKTDYIAMNYLFAPCAPLAQVVTRIGCIFVGCCEGIPMSGGIYNPQKKEYLFPSQIVEGLLGLIIAVYFVVRAKKNNYKPDAMAYPIMMVMFGSTRFICEFFRADGKLFLGCTKLGLHALFLAIVGIVAILIMKNRKKQNEH